MISTVSYTFENQCVEFPELSLGDGAIRIFFNTHGTNDDGMDPELIELLRYIEHTTEEVSRECKSERIKDMQKRIEAIKSNEEIGVRYMQAWEEKVLGEQKAREEGRSEGQERLNKLYARLLEQNRAEDIARATKDTEYLRRLYEEMGI